MCATKTVRKTKKVVSLADKQAKLEKAKARIVVAESKLKIEELRSVVSKTNIVQIFQTIKKSNKKVKDVDILMTIASILKIKATVSPRVSVKRTAK
jgi:hypothetical protein